MKVVWRPGPAGPGRRLGVRGRGAGCAAAGPASPDWPARPVRCRRGRLQHGDRLPGSTVRPSYAGQVIAFTYPTSATTASPRRRRDRKPFCRGVIVRELTRPAPATGGRPRRCPGSSPRHGLAAIAGIDTRRLTRRIRDAGAMPGRSAPWTGKRALSTRPPCWPRPGPSRPTEGRDLVSEVSCTSAYRYGGTAPFEVVAYDFGIKRNHPAQPGRPVASVDRGARLRHPPKKC